MNEFYKILFLFLTLFLSLKGLSQENQDKKDTSKPTNVYSQIDNFFEFVSASNFNTLGYNPKLTYATSDELSFVLEVPLRYHNKSKHFGMGDIRFRSFYVPYKNYENTLGSFGVSIDIFAPTGKYEYGLGTSSWRISPGIIVGFILNESQTISIFPNLSYTYTSKPSSTNVPVELQETDHGITFQITNSFVLSEDAFLLITPIYDVKDIKDEKEDEVLLEIEPVFDIFNDKYQAGVFYRGAFESKTHTFSVYFTVFL
jgi:hypothetical protein